MQPVRAVLFACFGTLVTHEGDRRDLAYEATAQLLHQWGYGNACERFADVWHAVTHTLELSTSRSLQEFSMGDVVDAYDEAEQLDLDDDRRAELLASFMREWRLGVRPVAGVGEMLASLSSTVPLGIVSNTHDEALVPGLLDEFDLARHFNSVVLSVTHGRRKPHPSIYTASLEALGDVRLEPGEVLFVGDTYHDDYVGPLAAGFRARLIDPSRRHPIPDGHRLDAILDL